MQFFFFKQKTAYEMRISDWSSDVCSSDLCEAVIAGAAAAVAPAHGLRMLSDPRPIESIDNHDLQKLGDKLALATLQQACANIKGTKDDILPLHSLMAVFADSEELINTGMYPLAALVSGNESDNSVTLAKKVEKE